MKGFSTAATRELRRVAGSPGLLAALTVIPALGFLIMAAMLSQGALRQLPIAVVDRSESAASRLLIAGFKAEPELRIIERPLSSLDAERQMRSGQIWAYVDIPPDFAQFRAAATSEPVRIFYNAAYLSVGAVLERRLNTAVTGSLRESLLGAARDSGLPAVRIPAPTVQVSILFNPQASFEWYLQALVQPAILHLLAACVGVYAMASELNGRSLARWRSETGGGIAPLAAKLLTYLAPLAFWGAAWMIWIVGFRGWRMEGSLLFAYVAELALFAATLAISFLLVSATRKPVSAFSVSALYAGSALAYSGTSIPVSGSLPTKVWSEILPFTHYLQIEMNQFLGTPVRHDLPDFALLCGYAAAALALSAVASRHESLS